MAGSARASGNGRSLAGRAAACRTATCLDTCLPSVPALRHQGVTALMHTAQTPFRDAEVLITGGHASILLITG